MLTLTLTAQAKLPISPRSLQPCWVLTADRVADCTPGCSRVGRQEGGLTTGLLRSESAVLISIQDKSFTQPDSLAAVPTTKLISFPALIYKVSPPFPLPCLSLAPKP